MVAEKLYSGDASQSKAGNPIPATRGVARISFQAITTGLDQGDATLSMEQTNDASNENSWVAVPDSSITIGSGDDSNFVILDTIRGGSAFVRFVYSSGSNTSGSVEIWAG